MTSLAERFAELQGMYGEDVEKPARKRKWPYFAAAGLAGTLVLGGYIWKGKPEELKRYEHSKREAAAPESAENALEGKSRVEYFRGVGTSEFVRNTYTTFKKISRRIGNLYNNNLFDSEKTDQLYGEACTLFGGLEDFRPGGKEVVGYLKELAEPVDGTGLFLSAMLNQTGMEEMVIGEFPFLDFIGYKIKPGKRLVLEKDAVVHSAGTYGRGDVLNKGRVKRMASCAEGGFQGNWGEVENDIATGAKGGFQGNWGEVKYMTHLAKGGFQGNWGEIREHMALDVLGGFQGNWETVNSLATSARGGFQGNWGNAKELAIIAKDGIQGNWGNAKEFGSFAEGGIQLNAGTISKNDKYSKVQDSAHDKKLAALEKELNTKISEVDFLKNLKSLEPDKVGEIQEKIRGYDFGKFEKEVLHITGLIEAHVRDKYEK